MKYEQTWKFRQRKCIPLSCFKNYMNFTIRQDRLYQLFMDLANIGLGSCVCFYAFFYCLRSPINICKLSGAKFIILYPIWKTGVNIDFKTFLHNMFYQNYEYRLRKSFERMTILTQEYENMFLIKIIFWSITILLYSLWINVQSVLHIWLNL